MSDLLRTARSRITAHQRDCVHALSDAGRDAKRISDCTGIPALAVNIILLERSLGKAIA